MSKEQPKKRGRKRTTNLYFGPEQETAVVDFLTSESYSERNILRICMRILFHF
jgi:hypothetical protein